MDELQAAQEALIAKRLSMGLLEDGTHPKTTWPVAEVLTAVLKGDAKDPQLAGLTSSLFRSKEACTRTCSNCQRHLEPIEWGHETGRILYAPRNCPDCWPKEQAETEERLARQEREKRCERYRGKFPGFEEEMRAKSMGEFDRPFGAEKAIARVNRYIDQLPKPDPPGLFIYGGPGNGKSNLAGIIALEGRKRLMGVAWIKVYKWLRYLGGLREPAEREALIDLASEADLLILDDLGVRYPTAPQAEWLMSIVDAVYQRKGLVVATSNHAPNDLAAALTPQATGKDEPEFLSGDRIMDRLTELAYPWVENTAPSYRIELARRRIQTVEGDGIES